MLKEIGSRPASVQFLLQLYCRQTWQNNGQLPGFTLLELLVAMIIGSILTTALLFSAVQLMGTNQREASRSDTQREVQAALDYIARDLREAIYVYDGQCLNPTGYKSVAQNSTQQGNCTGLLPHLPAQLNGADNLPVLALWRLDPLPEPLEQLCRAPDTARQLSLPRPPNTPPRPIDELNCGAKRMYTLVVYSLNINNPSVGGSSTWKGRARITRYQLPKYTFSNSSNITTGWVAPDGTESTFLSWPRIGQNAINRSGVSIAPGQPPARATYWDNKVLVDFIDGPVAGRPIDNTQVACPAAPVARVGGSTPLGFIPTPDPTGAYLANTNLAKNIFYACVRGSGGGNLNQEVLVRIRANAAGKSGLDRNRADVPLTMETRVLTRGVVGKDT
jgi:prepilin-type N-terminal cleavage/methylation domain-containing protein